MCVVVVGGLRVWCLSMSHIEKGEGYKYFVLFSHEICHQKFSDRNAGSLEEEIEKCA